MKKSFLILAFLFSLAQPSFAQVFDPNPRVPPPQVNNVAIALSQDQKIVGVGTGYGSKAVQLALESCSRQGGSGCWLAIESTGRDQCVSVASDPNLWIGRAIWQDAGYGTAYHTAARYALDFCAQSNGGNRGACQTRVTLCNHQLLN